MSNITDKPWLVPGHMYQYDTGWLIDKLLSFEDELNTAIDLKTIHYADPLQWDITTQYSPNTVVIDPKSGTAYMSKAAVPTGVQLSNTDYWVVIFNYQRVYDKIMSGVAYNDKDNPTATKDIAVNDLVWVGGDLYRATRALPAGTKYIPGTNLTSATIADCFKQYYGTDRTAQLINDTLTVSGDWTVSAGDAAVTADDLTVHVTQDAELDVDGTYSEHVDGVTTKNYGAGVTEVYGASRDVKITGTDTEVYSGPVSRTYSGKVAESGKDYRGTFDSVIYNIGDKTIDLSHATVYDVTQWGAVGDGKTDDYSAIQATMDAAMATGGGCVVFPSGTYAISQPLVIRPHTAATKQDGTPQSIHFLDMDRLMLCGLGQTKIIAKGSIDYLITFSDFSYPDNVGSYSNFYTHIVNLKLDGSNVTKYPLYIYQALHSVIAGCQIYNCNAGIGVYGYGELKITDNVIKATSHCIEMISGGDSLIYKNDLYMGDSGNGVTMTAYAGSTSIFKNTFTPINAGISGHSNNSNGVNLYNGEWNDSPATTGPVFIHDNSFDGVCWGVKAYSSTIDRVTALHVHDNKITNNNGFTASLISAQGVSNIDVHNNILGVAESYEGTPSKLVELTECRDCIIHHNIVTSSQDSPIKLYNALRIVVDGNYIHNYGQTSDTSAAAVSIRGNSSNCIVRNNTIVQDVQAASHVGVNELDTADYNRAVANTFKGVTTPLVVNGNSSIFIFSDYGYAPPTSGAYTQGSLVYNQKPSTGVFAWLCTSAGAPGTWTPIKVSI